MFMPFNYMGFGFGGCFGGGFYAPPCCCCNPFGFLPSFNPIISNMVIYNPFTTTSLCSVPSYNYNFQNSFNYQTPDISAFIPKMDFSQYTTQPTQNISMDGFYNNLVSTISKNVLGSSQTQTTPIVDQTKKEEDDTSPAKSESGTQTYSPVTKPKEISYDAQKLETKWKNSKFAKQSGSNIKNLPSEFFQKVVDISKKINCDPNDLMAVMNFESGGTFSASVKNSDPKSTATGLIQFTETTASGRKKKDGTREGGLGTTCAALAQMTETQQLEYVEKYFINRKKEGKFGNDYIDLATLYALVLAPGRAKGDVLYNKNNDGVNYTQNSGLDKNNDDNITKAEAARRVMNCLV